MRLNHSCYFSLKSLLRTSTAVGVILVGGALPVAADEPAVSGLNGKLAVAGGLADIDGVSQEEIGLLVGSVTMPLGHSFGLQIDGAAGEQDGYFVGGVGGHAFWRDPAVGLFGLTGAYVESDSGAFSSSTVVAIVGVQQTTTTTTRSRQDRRIGRLGGEGELYFGQITIGGAAGYQFGDGIEEGFYGAGVLRGYLTDNFILSAGAGYVEGSGAVATFGAEFQPGLGGLSMFADAAAGEDDFVQALFGIRYYFGLSQSLIDRHRRDDPSVNLVQDVLGSSIAPVSTTSTSETIVICFVAGTQVLMADGTLKAIETIVAGDCVLGADGEINRVHDVETPLLGERLLYGFNGGRGFVTHDHPLMTADGWKAIAPAEAEAVHRDMPRVARLKEGDRLVVLAAVERCAIPAAVGNGRGAVAYETVCEIALMLIETITTHRGEPTQQVYNLKLGGNHTYFADGYLAHNR